MVSLSPVFSTQNPLKDQAEEWKVPKQHKGNMLISAKPEVWDKANRRKPKSTEAERNRSARLHLSKLQVDTKYVVSAFVRVAALKAELLCSWQVPSGPREREVTS